MTDDIARMLRETFHEAVAQHAQSKIKTAEDWRTFGDLKAQFAKDREALIESYHVEYSDRVAEKRADLLADRTHHDLREIKPIGPTPSTDDIEAQAHRQVRRDHETELARSYDAEDRAIETLLETVRQGNLPHDMAKTEFNRVNDRRSGVDRRGPHRSQD